MTFPHPLDLIGKVNNARQSITFHVVKIVKIFWEMISTKHSKIRSGQQSTSQMCETVLNQFYFAHHVLITEHQLCSKKVQSWFVVNVWHSSLAHAS